MSKIELAIYDMDRTITHYGTYTPFLMSWALRHRPWRLVFVPLVVLCLAAYAAKLISRGRLKTLMLFMLVGKPTRQQLEPAIEHFVGRLMAKAVYPGALAQLAADRAAGKRLVLATASYDFYVGAIARRLGMDDVVATRAMWDATDAIRPGIEGENCYGEAKLVMVKAYLREVLKVDRKDCHIVFYSDHHSDLPMFEYADEQVVTNPNRKLLAIAQARGWPVVRWGRTV
ncbi:HAD family hydrolase [Pedomonas sp. V897]|uniref:HAD family hydrolase n=1 Tax=Pedomonas sp. V897 TaxID=3446482 RepID=UPI003EE1A09E